MKRLVWILALTAALSTATLAGDIHNVDSPAPAPSGTPQGINSPSSTLLVPGDIPIGESAQPVLNDALSAFLSVLGLVV